MPPEYPKGTLYPQKVILTKSMYKVHFVISKIIFFVWPTLLGGPLVKLAQISTIAPRRKGEIKNSSHISCSSYMILVCRIFFRAPPLVHLDTEIWIFAKSASLYRKYPEIWISESGLTGRALKKFLLTKIIYELQLLLLELFYFTHPSRGYSTDLCKF